MKRCVLMACLAGIGLSLAEEMPFYRADSVIPSRFEAPVSVVESANGVAIDGRRWTTVYSNDLVDFDAREVHGFMIILR